MAKKLKLMSLFQELSGRAAVTNRRPVPPSAGMYLMQLRSQSGATTLPRRRFMIEVDLRTVSSRPAPVKINHVQIPASAAASAPAPAAPLAAGGRALKMPQVRSETD